MPENTSGFGFGRKNHDEQNRYLDKFVCVQQNGNSVYGIFKKIDKIKGCAYFMPSIVGNADDSLGIMHDLPTKIDLPLTIIRPMPETLEEYVTKYNKNLKHKKNKQRRK